MKATNNFVISQYHNDLKILAAKYPYNDGPAVFQARTILSQIETIEYLNPCETQSVESDRSMIIQQVTEKKKEEFKLFPNPNDGAMNFIYSLKDGAKGDLYIYDIAGKLITKYSLQSRENNQIFIKEEELKNGIYFYKVIIDNELKASDKIVIIK